MAGAAPLKLRAADPEDLRTVSALLQDALVPLSDVTYLKAERRFVLVASRFRWELAPERVAAEVPEAPSGETAEDRDARFDEADETGPHDLFQRVNCGLRIEAVRGVRLRGLDPRQKDQILNLLAVEGEADAVTLVFSDGGEIRVEVGAIRCLLEDLGEPWPTRWRPSHSDLDEGPDR